MVYLLTVVIGFLIFLGIVWGMRYPYGGSDHAYHYKLIQLIKQNGHRFVYSYNDFSKHLAVCPQLYHIICSFFSNVTLLNRANFMNYVIMFLILVGLNVFLWLLSMYAGFDFTNSAILLINVLFVTLPIFYAVWNAKFMGLSARAFGCLWVYLYLMGLFFYILNYDVMFVYLVVLGFFLLLSSQFGFQFFIFANIFIAFLVKKYEILLSIPLSIILLFIFNFSYAKSFLKTQIHHKRNYSKFMIKDCHFKVRYSIWRDFIYDFWVKKDKNYIFGNPAVEVFIGAFPSCFVLIAYWFIPIQENVESVRALYLLASSAFFAFFLTSLRIFRFLGEPQRYIEFGMPFSSILCVVLLPMWVSFAFLVMNLLILFLYAKNSSFHRQLPEHIKIREELMEYCNAIFDVKYQNLLTNDHEIGRHFYITKYEPHLPNYCAYYKDKEAFLSNFYKGDYHRISPLFIVQEIKKSESGILILYTNMLKFYDEHLIIPMLEGVILEHLRDIGKFKVFKFFQGAL